jgi:hypothetical protein
MDFYARRSITLPGPPRQLQGVGVIKAQWRRKESLWNPHNICIEEGVNDPMALNKPVIRR